MDENTLKLNTSSMHTIRKNCNVFAGLIVCGKCGVNYQVTAKDRRKGSGFRPSSYTCTGKYQKNHCDNLNVSDVKIGPFMINYIAAMVDASKSRKFIKDTKSLEQVLLSHISFSNIVGIANDSLQETLELISGYSASKSALWSAETLSKEQQTDVDSKQSELNERLQKVNRAMERLKKVYLFSDDGMDEKEFLEMKSSLEADRVKIENEIKGLSTPIATNVDQVAFIKSASEFLLMHKINSGEFVDYKELATLDEESLKQFMNSVIDHIVVRERKIVEIVFINGLSHTLLYK